MTGESEVYFDAVGVADSETGAVGFEGGVPVYEVGVGETPALFEVCTGIGAVIGGVVVCAICCCSWVYRSILSAMLVELRICYCECSLNEEKPR